MKSRCKPTPLRVPSHSVPQDMLEPPPEMLMPLLPYQKQFLAWAIKQVCSVMM